MSNRTEYRIINASSLKLLCSRCADIFIFLITHDFSSKRAQWQEVEDHNAA